MRSRVSGSAESRERSAGQRFLDAGHQLGDRAFGARGAARPEQHVPQDQAERIDVGAVIDRLRHRLFGRHVFERADHRPRHRCAAAGHRARDAEVHDDRLVIASIMMLAGFRSR